MKCVFGSWKDRVLCEVSPLWASLPPVLQVPPAGFGGEALVSLAGRTVLILLPLPSGLRVLWEDLRSLPGFGSRGKFVRPLYQNPEGMKSDAMRGEVAQAPDSQPPVLSLCFGDVCPSRPGPGGRQCFLWGLNRALGAT